MFGLLFLIFKLILNEVKCIQTALQPLCSVAAAWENLNIFSVSVSADS